MAGQFSVGLTEEGCRVEHHIEEINQNFCLDRCRIGSGLVYDRIEPGVGVGQEIRRCDSAKVFPGLKGGQQRKNDGPCVS